MDKNKNPEKKPGSHKKDWTQEKAYEKIEFIYNTEGGKKFISHLLRSFLPAHKSVYLDFPPEETGKELKCCITGIPLVSKTEAIGLSMSVSLETILKRAKAELAKDKEEKEKFEKEATSLVNDVFKGRMLAITSKESDKYFSPIAFDAFMNWWQNKFLSGDKHINWIFKSMKKNELFKHMDSKGTPLSQKTKKAVNKAVNKPHKTTLEDNQELKSLLEKLKKDESK